MVDPLDERPSMSRSIADRTRSSWRFRWEGLTVAWLCGLAACAAVAFVPNVYQVHAAVAVNPQALTRLVAELYPEGRKPSAPVEQLKAVILHPDQLEKTAHAANLPRHEPVWDWSKPSLQYLEAQLEVVKIESDSDVYRISLQDTYHRHSLRLIEAVLKVLDSSLIQHADAESKPVEDVSDRQVAQAEFRLASAERDLADFERRAPDAEPGNPNDEAAALDSAVQVLADLQERRRGARQRMNSLEQRLEDVRSTSASGRTPQAGSRAAEDSLDQRILELRSQLDRLRQTLHSTHPDVVVTRKSLERLYAERERELVEFGLTPYEARSLPLGATGAYRDVLKQTAETREAIARLDRDVARQEERIAELRTAHDSASRLSVEAESLRERVASARAEYEALLVSRRALQPATADADDATFTVMAAPIVAAEPVAPQRLLWFVSILGGSVVLGCMASFVLSLRSAVFYDGAKLEAAARLPVVGLITHAWRSQLRRRFRRQFLAISVGAVVFISVSTAIVVAQMHSAVL